MHTVGYGIGGAGTAIASIGLFPEGAAAKLGEGISKVGEPSRAVSAAGEVESTAHLGSRGASHPDSSV